MKHIVFMSLTDTTEQSYLLSDIACMKVEIAEDVYDYEEMQKLHVKPQDAIIRISFNDSSIKELIAKHYLIKYA